MLISINVMANVLVIKISGCPAQGVTLLPAHIIDTICKLPIVIVAK